jgi:hypothetical protein
MARSPLLNQTGPRIINLGELQFPSGISGRLDFLLKDRIGRWSWLTLTGKGTTQVTFFPHTGYAMAQPKHLLQLELFAHNRNGWMPPWGTHL